MVKILVYGFKPFGGLKKNISEEIIKKIGEEKDLKKIIFSVDFNKKMFINKIKKIDPQFILGLGLCPRGEKIRIERKAVNIAKKENKKENIILNNKPHFVFFNWKLKKDKNSRISYNAKKYVCNYSMYIVSTLIKDAKFAFLHIPKDYDIKKALRYIKKILQDTQKIKTSTSSL